MKPYLGQFSMKLYLGTFYGRARHKFHNYTSLFGHNMFNKLRFIFNKPLSSEILGLGI